MNATPHSALRTPHSSGGFTLNEVMMTVIIVGILASIAIPSYRKTIERGYHRTAQDLLMAIYNGERSYYFTHSNTYYPNQLDSASGVAWRNIYVDDPHIGSIPVTFFIPAAGVTFTATATRNGGGGSISINQDREWCGNPACTTADSCPNCTWRP